MDDLYYAHIHVFTGYTVGSWLMLSVYGYYDISDYRFAYEKLKIIISSRKLLKLTRYQSLRHKRAQFLQSTRACANPRSV